MKNKLFKNFTVFACVLMLVVLVGCGDNVVSDAFSGIESNGFGTGYVGFSSGDGSRGGVLSQNESSYDQEELYWTYTAEKTDGGSAIGATTVQKTVDKSLENSKGLTGKIIGPLSSGEWKFTLYGYLNSTDVDKETGDATVIDGDNVLIYKGEKTCTVTVSADPSTKHDTFQVDVKLDDGQTEGRLAMGTFSLTIPEGQRITGSEDSPATLVVRLLDVTAADSPELVAFSKTEIKEIKDAGASVELGEFELIEDRDFYETGSTDTDYQSENIKFEFIAEYKDSATVDNYSDGVSLEDLENSISGNTSLKDTTAALVDFAPVGKLSGYNFKFTRGVTSVFTGNLDYANMSSGGTGNMNIKVAVAKIAPSGKPVKYYASLKDASEESDSDYTGQVITLLMNIDDIDGDSVSDSVSNDVTVDVNGKVLSNVSITSGKTLTLLAENNASRSYAFTGGTVDFEYSGANVTYNTSGTSAVTVNAASDTVTHTGSVTSVAITNADMYKLDTAGAEVTTVTATTGKLEIGNGVKIATLTVEPGVTELTAHEFSDVTAIKCGTGGSVVLKDGGASVAGATEVWGASMFKCISLNYAGATKYIYGIKGMKIKLPTVAVAFGTGSKMMYWYTKTNRSDKSGAVFGNGEEFVCGGKVYTVDGNGAVIEVTVTALFAQEYPTS